MGGGEEIFEKRFACPAHVERARDLDGKITVSLQNYTVIRLQVSDGACEHA